MEIGMASEKSNEIVNKFCKYIKIGNKTLIECYSIEELRRAKYEYAQDSYREFYKAIEDRIKELEDMRIHQRSIRERWKDRFIENA